VGTLFTDVTFDEYLHEMGTTAWGDELTLTAIADEYDVDVRVISSNAANWYLHYQPSFSQRDSEDARGSYDSADSTKRSASFSPATRRTLFVCYISPVN
jgi:hypothetical protein